MLVMDRPELLARARQYQHLWLRDDNTLIVSAELVRDATPICAVEELLDLGDDAVCITTVQDGLSDAQMWALWGDERIHLVIVRLWRWRGVLAFGPAQNGARTVLYTRATVYSTPTWMLVEDKDSAPWTCDSWYAMEKMLQGW